MLALAKARRRAEGCAQPAEAQPGVELQASSGQQASVAIAADFTLQGGVVDHARLHKAVVPGLHLEATDLVAETFDVIEEREGTDGEGLVVTSPTELAPDVTVDVVGDQQFGDIVGFAAQSDGDAIVDHGGVVGEGAFVGPGGTSVVGDVFGDIVGPGKLTAAILQKEEPFNRLPGGAA